jgi:hypothetical protein
MARKRNFGYPLPCPAAQLDQNVQCDADVNNPYDACILPAVSQYGKPFSAEAPKILYFVGNITCYNLRVPF